MHRLWGRWSQSIDREHARIPEPKSVRRGEDCQPVVMSTMSNRAWLTAASGEGPFQEPWSVIGKGLRFFARSHRVPVRSRSRRKAANRGIRTTDEHVSERRNPATTGVIAGFCIHLTNCMGLGGVEPPTSRLSGQGPAPQQLLSAAKYKRIS